jgi:membrane protein YdbS with pleckstrin-like domain
MQAETVVRIAITSFVVILIAIAAAGWIWTGAHQPAPQAMAGRAVLALSVRMGLVGMKAMWSHRR